MDERDLFKRIEVINKETRRLDEQNPSDPEEETDPRIRELFDEGIEIMKQLDPIIREKFRDDPATLAEWDEIMHMCDDLDEDDPDNSGASRTP